MKEVKARRDFVAAELAAGRNPTETLEAILTPTPRRTLHGIFQDWKASRLDLDPRTIANCDFHWKRLEPSFGSLTVDEITFQHIPEWISENAQGERPLTPGGLRNYIGTLKQMLDFAGVDPNVARDRRIRFPTAERTIPTPPSAAHVRAMLEKMPLEQRLVFVARETSVSRFALSVSTGASAGQN
jgi:hypothetical protein